MTDQDCAICFEKLHGGPAAMTTCKHFFHKNCIKDLKKCPLCRAPLTASDTTTIVSLRPLPREFMANAKVLWQS